EQREYARAVDLLGMAAASEPYNITAVYNLGLALTRRGQSTEGTAMLQRAQALRGTGYAVTYGTGYLEQGRYAEAVASTGAEPALVDLAVPNATFTPVTITARGGGTMPPSPFGRRYSTTELGTSRSLIAAGLGGGLALLDFDGDGDLDVLDVSPFAQ